MELVKINTDCDCSLAWAIIEDVEVSPGEHLIIQTKQGPKLAKVKSEKHDATGCKKGKNMFKVIRKATEEDIDNQNRLNERKKEAFSICNGLIRSHKLEMKLVQVEFLIDESKAIFYFTADGRIDFRELVKDLAHNFHTRIEMRQIGVRDEAKMMGGLGNCGKEFCCSSFLCSFEPVSVKMAKEQNLALNPMKISGACGRLMCCLSYEHSTYVALKKEFPPVGRMVKTEFGEGRIVRRDVLNSRVTVVLDTGSDKTLKLSEVVLLSRDERARSDKARDERARDEKKRDEKRDEKRDSRKPKRNRDRKRENR